MKNMSSQSISALLTISRRSCTGLTSVKVCQPAWPRGRTTHLIQLLVVNGRFFQCTQPRLLKDPLITLMIMHQYLMHCSFWDTSYHVESGKEQSSLDWDANTIQQLFKFCFGWCPHRPTAVLIQGRSRQAHEYHAQSSAARPNQTIDSNASENQERQVFLWNIGEGRDHEVIH